MADTADRAGRDERAGRVRRLRLTGLVKLSALAAAGLLLGSAALPTGPAADRLPERVTLSGRPALAPAVAGCTDGPNGGSSVVSLTPSTDDSGPDVQRIIKRGKLIAGIDTNSYLWGFRDPSSGNLEGFDIDLVHALAQSILGNADDVEFLSVPTADRITALQSGEVDVVVRTMTISCAREQQVAFSSPYYLAGQEVLVPKSSSITGYNSTLAGKKVCAATGSTAVDNFLDQDKKGSTVVQVENQLDCLVLMQLGLVDATITDNALGAGQAAQDPTIHLVGGLMDAEYYGVAMKLGADDLVRRVNAVLQSYLADQWNAEYDEWLKPVGPNPGPPSVTYSG
ncbi:glutamate ABC transporter substrate-binding protein [Streptacidiphilus albus]|uniref:glutamate ABC transporter substrate-binding protein n=1 Tax=Streptacidiphilus albus TaxID=105425 RepID=UPI0005A91B63|nr:glutamate ABC transporter substrate-binding protein [Streptacidiphilus albus]